jgi:RNA polymerase sigma-70 factor (ECF subfamily)
MQSSTGEVTRLLFELRSGNPAAEAKLIPLVYADLHRLAAHCMRRERSNHTLQPTALVNEAYLRLVSQEGMVWQDRVHFFRVAARLMRQILVDHARARQTGKRGGDAEKIPLDELPQFSGRRLREPIELNESIDLDELIELDAALKALGRLDPRQEKVVDLRFFGGLTEEETAQVLGISPRSVKRDWRVARAWLFGELSAKAEGSNGSERRRIDA